MNRGDVIQVYIPPERVVDSASGVGVSDSVGHEQHGLRRAVVVQDLGRFPQGWSTVVVVPVTASNSALEHDAHARVIPTSSNGFTKVSLILASHMRVIDRRRIRAVLGTLDGADMHKLEDAMRFVLGLR